MVDQFKIVASGDDRSGVDHSEFNHSEFNQLRVNQLMAAHVRSCGEFPRVLSISFDAGSFQLELEVTEDLDGFKGHFPGNPVLPGVVQLHWAASFAGQLYAYQDMPMEIKQLKFKKVVQPPATLSLKIRHAVDSKVYFEFSSPLQEHDSSTIVSHSSGQLIFGQNLS